jgi:hypothetical protein
VYGHSSARDQRKARGRPLRGRKSVAQAAGDHSIYFKKLLAFPRARMMRISSDCRKAAAIIRAMVVIGRGRRPSSQQADDPCRAIKIVALTGQLCATLQQTPDCNRTRYSKSACRGPGKYGSAGLQALAARADRFSAIFALNQPA